MHLNCMLSHVDHHAWHSFATLLSSRQSAYQYHSWMHSWMRNRGCCSQKISLTCRIHFDGIDAWHGRESLPFSTQFAALHDPSPPFSLPSKIRARPFDQELSAPVTELLLISSHAGFGRACKVSVRSPPPTRAEIKRDNSHASSRGKG